MGQAEIEEGLMKTGPMKTVLIYVNPRKQVGDVDHLKVFANQEAADRWFKANEGVAFEYEEMGTAEQPDEFFERPGG